jgi:hypothetical protein
LSNSELELLGFGLDLDLTSGKSHQGQKSERLDERHGACKGFFLQELLSNNYADGYFIAGYGHPSCTVVFISTVSYENVNMSKRDVYKQMVPCGKIQLVYHAD